MPDSELQPRSAFAGIAAVGSGHGLVVEDLDGLQLVAVIARETSVAACAARIRDRYGLELPTGPRRIGGAGLAVAGTAPAAWLTSREKGAPLWDELAGLLGGMAAVIDQSSGLAALRLSGPSLRDVLAKLVALDLHPRAFASGCVATTVAAHIAITLWRLEDAADGTPRVEIAVPRSLAASFWHALAESAAEFGCMVAERHEVRS